MPYGGQYPDALRRILVENGTLNADGTPNEATAARLGWKLADPPLAAPAPASPRTGGAGGGAEARSPRPATLPRADRAAG